MKSGNPEPADELRLLIQAKRHAPSRTVEVVSATARWLKAALKGADVAYSYASCEEEDHYGYAAFTVLRFYRGEPVSLDLKIAEIRETPYFFAEVRSLGKFDGTLFPFFGEAKSEDGRSLLLHYVADFVMGTDAPGSHKF